jgi:hypothetical protein
MHEHGGENRDDIRPRIRSEVCREKRLVFNKLVAPAELYQEHQHVQADENEGDDRKRAAFGIVVT